MDEKKVPIICDEGYCRPRTPTPVEVLPPAPLCTVVVTYPKGAADQPLISYDPQMCPNPEVALAILVAALLRARE